MAQTRSASNYTRRVENSLYGFKHAVTFVGQVYFGKKNIVLFFRFIFVNCNLVNLYLGRQTSEGTVVARLTDDKAAGSSPTPSSQPSVSSPTHVPGSYRMLQKYS